jgi:S-DNA-T family DNA segregation ATPase FtsK/SpoIIIE
VIDDAELLRETALDDAVADAVRAARDRERAVVVAGMTEALRSAYRGFLADVLRSRSGLLLGVQSPDDGEMLGIRLPRNTGGGGPTGRGVLVRLGTAMPVQVALPDGS